MPASFTEGNLNGTLNGASEVTLVSSPAASTRRLVRLVSIHNRDTADVTVTVRYKDGANTRQIYKITLEVGDTLRDDDVHILDDTDDSITAVMSGAPATTNPDWECTYADVTS